MGMGWTPREGSGGSGQHLPSPVSSHPTFIARPAPQQGEAQSKGTQGASSGPWWLWPGPSPGTPAPRHPGSRQPQAGGSRAPRLGCSGCAAPAPPGTLPPSLLPSLPPSLHPSPAPVRPARCVLGTDGPHPTRPGMPVLLFALLGEQTLLRGRSASPRQSSPPWGHKALTTRMPPCPRAVTAPATIPTTAQRRGVSALCTLGTSPVGHTIPH